MNKVVFLHIPKTAGTTLKSIIERNYSEGEIANLYDQHVDVNDISFHLNNDITRVICGHFDYQEIFNSRDTYVFTFLRNPVDRVISNYLHIKYSDSSIHQKWMEKVNTFPDFLNLPQGSNWQSRLLAGFKHETPTSEIELLERSTNTIQRLNFVGIMEDFMHGLYCLSDDLEWLKTWHKKENILADRSEFDEIKVRFRDEIESANKIDLEIYHTGKQLFDNSWKSLSQLQRMQSRLRRMR